MKLRICKKEEFERCYVELSYRPVASHDEAAVAELEQEFQTICREMQRILAQRGLRPGNEVVGTAENIYFIGDHRLSRFLDLGFWEDRHHLKPDLWLEVQGLLAESGLDWMVCLGSGPDFILVTRSEITAYSHDLEGLKLELDSLVEIEVQTE